MEWQERRNVQFEESLARAISVAKHCIIYELISVWKGNYFPSTRGDQAMYFYLEMPVIVF